MDGWYFAARCGLHRRAGPDPSGTGPRDRRTGTRQGLTAKDAAVTTLKEMGRHE